MDLLEVRIALPPNQFTGIHGGNNIEQQGRNTLHCLQHQVGHRPDIGPVSVSGKVAVGKASSHHQNSDSPKGNLAKDIAEVDSRERSKLP